HVPECGDESGTNTVALTRLVCSHGRHELVADDVLPLAGQFGLAGDAVVGANIRLLARRVEQHDHAAAQPAATVVPVGAKRHEAVLQSVQVRRAVQSVEDSDTYVSARRISEW